MLTKISMWFYKKHEKQMRHCNIYFLTLFTVSVSGPVRSFLCQQYTPPLRCVQTSRVCARTSAHASARISTRASAHASTRNTSSDCCWLTQISH
jgi:hypothetical protein